MSSYLNMNDNNAWEKIRKSNKEFDTKCVNSYFVSHLSYIISTNVTKKWGVLACLQMMTKRASGQGEMNGKKTAISLYC